MAMRREPSTSAETMVLGDKYDFLEALGILKELGIRPDQVAAWRAGEGGLRADVISAAPVVVKAPQGGPGGDPDKSTITFTGFAAIVVGGRTVSRTELDPYGRLGMDPGQEGQVQIVVQMDGHEDHMLGSQSFSQHYMVSWDVSAAADGTLAIKTPPQEVVQAPSGGTAYRLEGFHPDSDGKSFVQVAPVILSGSNSFTGLGFGNTASPAQIKETFRFDIAVTPPEHTLKKMEIGPITSTQTASFTVGPFKIGSAKDLEHGSVAKILFDFIHKSLPPDALKSLTDPKADQGDPTETHAVYSFSAIKTDGYASNTGPELHNLDLSRQRAETVIAEFVKLGVPKSAFLPPQPFGEWETDDPTDDPRQEKESAEWRKVEVSLDVSITIGVTHEI